MYVSYRLKIQAEYALSGFLFLLVILMTRTLYRRKECIYEKHFIQRMQRNNLRMGSYYKPVAVLRIAMLAYMDPLLQGNSSDNLKDKNQTNDSSMLPSSSSSVQESHMPSTKDASGPPKPMQHGMPSVKVTYIDMDVAAEAAKKQARKAIISNDDQEKASSE